MKKTYKKPMMIAEAFALAEHISHTCAYRTNFGNQCPITDAGVTFFTSSNTACSEDSASMFQFAGIDPKEATFEDLIGLNIQCYNSLQDYHQLFTS